MARPAYLRTLLALARHPGAERGQVDRFREAALRRVATHAGRNVPYYRKLFRKAGVDPGSIRTPADLRAIPITERRTLQSLPPRERLSAGSEPHRLLHQNTSGSSGKPLAVYRSRAERLLANSFRIRAQRSWGITRRDRLVHLTPYGTVRSPWLQVARFLTPFGPHRIHKISVFQQPDRIADALVRVQPSVLLGSAGPVSRVARRLADSGRNLPGLRMVLNGAETLTPPSRREIEAALSAPVFNWYGCWEANLIAWECRETGLMHVCDDSVIVEVLADGELVEEGAEGEVVITTLHRFSMPFLRYRLGDLVVRGAPTCPCGAPFSTLRAIQGRMTEFFELPDGRTLHPYRIMQRCMKPRRWVRQCQLVQESREHVVARIVARDHTTAAEWDRLRRCVEQGLGPGVRVTVERVSDLSLEETGKFRPYRSDLARSRP